MGVHGDAAGGAGRPRPGRRGRGGRRGGRLRRARASRPRRDRRRRAPDHAAPAAARRRGPRRARAARRREPRRPGRRALRAPRPPSPRGRRGDGRRGARGVGRRRGSGPTATTRAPRAWPSGPAVAAPASCGACAGPRPGTRPRRCRRWSSPTASRSARCVSGQDEDAVVAVNNRAFSWHPEQSGWTTDDVAAIEAESWFDADGVLLAWDTATGDLLGFHFTKVHAVSETVPEPLGEVYVVGVDPAARGAVWAGRSPSRGSTISATAVCARPSCTWRATTPRRSRPTAAWASSATRWTSPTSADRRE